MLQAERTGLTPQQAKELMTGIWNSTKNGTKFQVALAEKGWIFARGDRRDFVAIDPAGGGHSIARRIDGAKAADVRSRFSDIDPRSLQSVAEAKRSQHQHHRGHDRPGEASRRLWLYERMSCASARYGCFRLSLDMRRDLPWPVS